MLMRFMEAVFAPKFLRHYRGRHRASVLLIGGGAPAGQVAAASE